MFKKYQQCRIDVFKEGCNDDVAEWNDDAIVKFYGEYMGHVKCEIGALRPIHTSGLFSRSKNNFSQVLSHFMSLIKKLFKFYWIFVCDLTSEKLVAARKNGRKCEQTIKAGSH